MTDVQRGFGIFVVILLICVVVAFYVGRSTVKHPKCPNHPMTIFYAGTIEGAIDLCEEYGGGTVMLGPGTFVVDNIPVPGG